MWSPGFCSVYWLARRGRLTNACYTALGQVAETWQLAPATSGAYNGVAATYFANGAAATLSAPGVPVITYG